MSCDTSRTSSRDLWKSHPDVQSFFLYFHKENGGQRSLQQKKRLWLEQRAALYLIASSTILAHNFPCVRIFSTLAIAPQMNDDACFAKRSFLHLNGSQERHQVIGFSMTQNQLIQNAGNFSNLLQSIFHYFNEIAIGPEPELFIPFLYWSGK